MLFVTVVTRINVMVSHAHMKSGGRVMTQQSEAENRKSPSPDMLLGLSLPALIEQFDIPLKYFSVAGFEIVMFGCEGRYLICTCSQAACVRARYSDTCAL